MKALIPFIFGQDALAASQTDAQLSGVASEASQVNDGYRMPFPYSVRAITWRTSVAATAGTLAIGVTKGGTEDTDSTINVTTETGGEKRLPRGKVKGAAGDVLGVEITTSGTWDGTTADLQVMVFVEFDVLGN